MEQIYQILEELRPEFNFRESTDYVEDGYLDSFDIVSIISTIEEQYDIRIDGLDVLPENFMNAEAIVNLIRKSGGNI